MNNPYCKPRQEVHHLLMASMRRFVTDVTLEALKTHSLAEIKTQITNDSGVVVDALNKKVALFKQSKENVEFFWALELSDFYFPHEETEICFELKNKVDPNSIYLYEDLISAFEDYTHIDCMVKSSSKSLSFQIKRFPTQYLGKTTDDFVGWLKEKVLAHYSDDMKGTILAISLLPAEKYEEIPIQFEELFEILVSMSDQITFDEIVFVYNDNNQYSVLHKIFPTHKRLLIPIQWSMKRFRGEV